MIGNDLIYLPLWQKRSLKRQRQFLERITVPAEQSLLEACLKESALQSALAWSIKEATFKAWHRESGQRLLRPKDILIKHLHKRSDKVESNVLLSGFNYLCVSDIKNKYIHSISFKEGGKRLQFWRQYLGQKRPKGVQQDGRLYELEHDSAGRPLLRKNQYCHSTVSISHDGPYQAMVWAICGES